MLGIVIEKTKHKKSCNYQFETTGRAGQLFMLDITCSVCEGLKHNACSSPYCLNVLPAGDTCHGSFLVFGSAVYRQQLRRDAEKKLNISILFK